MKKTIYQNAIEQIDVLFDHVITNSASDFLRVDIGVVNTELAKEVFEQTNFSIENYEISIDSHGLRHTMNQHGSENEEQRGQIAIEREHFHQLSKIFEQPFEISRSRRSALGNDSVAIEKVFNQLLYVTVWEIRQVLSTKKNKKSRVVLKTFYIRKLKN
jgi:antitoxin component HigA of HigAB toxin-antitoxin module